MSCKRSRLQGRLFLFEKNLKKAGKSIDNYNPMGYNNNCQEGIKKKPIKRKEATIMMNAKMMETLKNAGIAKEWHKGDMHRLYIDLTKASDMYFDNNEYFQHGRMALNRYERNNGKVWVEIESGEICTKSIDSQDEVISQIMELVAFLMPEEKTEEEEETEETEEDTEEPRVWYAVMRDRDDNDWGTGSFDLEEAKAEVLQMDSPDAYIAVIDGQYDKDGNATTDPICVDEIMQEDF